MSRTVSTDDASRRLQFVWLGPVSSPWPFEARGQMWAVAGAATAVLAPLAFLAIPSAAVTWLVVPAALTKGVLALVLGTASAVLLTRRVARVITPTRPVRHHLHQVVGELDTPRPDGPAVTYEVAVPPALFVEHRAEHRQVHVLEVPDLWRSA